MTAIVAVVCLAVVLHGLQLASLRRISHDDTISFLAATGHQGEYQRVVDSGLAPVARWVPASRWQAFTQIERPLPLLTIARDLGHHDIHPPVYFWLLHVWSLLVGVYQWTGPALNVLLHALTAVVLWRLAHRIFGATLPASAVAGIWLTLPAVVETAASTRQYSLAALLSVLLVSAFLRACDAPTPRTLLAVSAWTTLGMLTLYTFGLLVAGLGIVALADVGSPVRQRSALRQLGAFAVAGVVFLAAQPWLGEALARQRAQAEPFSVARLALRTRLLLGELPQFAVADIAGLPAIAVLIVTVVLAVFAWRAHPAARPIVWLAVWVPAVMAVLYLAAISPGAAYQARYFSIALPWVAFLPVLAWPILQVRPAVLAATAVFAVAAIFNVSAALRAATAPPAATLEGPRPAVLDNLARGVLLRILWDAPPDLPVYAADQASLLATTDRWLRCDDGLPCHDQPLTLATQVQYEATQRGQQALLDAARRVRRVSPAPDIGLIADRYRLSAPTAAAAVPRSTTSSEDGTSQPGG
ncbi:MAG: glycosyltransferase family 39 protein [Actinobacteria bacterium]|nr:glycosyltransferase family 39 protein [Actinomycetota bacterium]